MTVVRICKHCHGHRLEDGTVWHYPFCPWGDGHVEPSRPYRQSGSGVDGGHRGHGGGDSGGGGDDGGERPWYPIPTLPKPGGTALPLSEPTRMIESKPILALPAPEVRHGEEVARLRVGQDGPAKP